MQRSRSRAADALRSAESVFNEIQINASAVAIYYRSARFAQIFYRKRERERVDVSLSLSLSLSVTWRFRYTARLIYCSQNREEQGGGEGEARTSATAGAAAARSAARSAGIGRLRVGDSARTCDSGGPACCHRSQRLQHQWYPGHSSAPSGSQRQQHQEEAQR